MLLAPCALAEPIPSQERADGPFNRAESEPAPNQEQSQGPFNRTERKDTGRGKGADSEPEGQRKRRGKVKAKGCLCAWGLRFGREEAWLVLVWFGLFLLSLGTAERHPSELLFIGAKVRKEADRIAECSSVTYFHRQERQPRGAEDCTGCGCRNLE